MEKRPIDELERLYSDSYFKNPDEFPRDNLLEKPLTSGDPIERGAIFERGIREGGYRLLSTFQRLDIDLVEGLVSKLQEMGLEVKIGDWFKITGLPEFMNRPLEIYIKDSLEKPKNPKMYDSLKPTNQNNLTIGPRQEDDSLLFIGYDLRRNNPPIIDRTRKPRRDENPEKDRLKIF